MDWIHENPPQWDESKAAILGGAPEGTFHTVGAHAPGDLVSGEWWRVEEDGHVLGYGWMDTTWGDAEILLAVEPGQRGRGVGTFILDHLESEAATRGLNYMVNVVPPVHPDPAAFRGWLERRRFEPGHEDQYRRRVRSAS